MVTFQQETILLLQNIKQHKSHQQQGANFAPFLAYITKIDEATIDDPEDLHLVMTIYNLIEYSSHQSETAGSLCFYSKDEAASSNADIDNDDNFKSIKYKAKLLECTVAEGAN